MSIENTSRERVFSILNDDSNPKFVIRQKQSAPSSFPQKLPPISTLSPKLERPHFLRQVQYQRNPSVSSSLSSAGSPPLLRFDSHSSKASSSSMDSTPSPITPAYQYNDTATLAYEPLLRPDLASAYLPSPTTITPFMEQQMMIGPGNTAQLPTFEPKAMPSLPQIYQSLPLAQNDVAQLPTPTLSNHASISSSSSAQSKTSPNTNGQQPTGKKNKYPCPYAASHNCMATFTTSGHAARHGKKHTGEKGVHCPVCNKAFTRKDNMKQHERTHKNQGNKNNNSDESRSKAALTRDAQKAKQHKKSESVNSINHARRTSIVQSPVSEVASLAPNAVDTPGPINAVEPQFYQDPSPPMMLLPDSSLVPDVLTQSLYPPLGDETLMVNGIPPMPEKLEAGIPQPPALIRGFSDLDTLAQAAEGFDTYYQNQF